MRRWSCLGLWHDHRNHSILVRDFGLRRINIMGQRNGPLKAAEGALHQVVQPSLMISGGAFFTADAQPTSINRNVDVFLAHARHFDFNNYRMGGLPRFARQQSPLGELLMRVSALLSLRSTNEMSKRTAAACQHLAPPLGKAFPSARDASLQF